jgi:Ca2+-transporting ATPase
MVGGQVMIIFVGGRAFNVVRLDPNQWAISIILGLLSIPVGMIIRMIPDEMIAQCLPRKLRKRMSPPKDEGKDGPENLEFINRIKGGRIRHIRRKVKESVKRHGNRPGREEESGRSGSGERY